MPQLFTRSSRMPRRLAVGMATETVFTAAALFLSTGAIAHAQSLGEFLGSITDIISIIVPLIFALIFITISWGVIKAWIMGEGSENDIAQGKMVLTVGIIVLVIMVSLWGILNILRQGLFGF